MAKKLFPVLLLIIVVILAGGGYYLATKDDDSSKDKSNETTQEEETDNADQSEESTDSGKAALGDSKSFSLTEQNNSGENGEVRFDEVDGKVQVTVVVTNGTATPQPAHIHVGKCPTPGSVLFPLENVMNGASVTILDTTFAELKAKGDLAVNIHKSAEESSVYVSCADLSF